MKKFFQGAFLYVVIFIIIIAVMIFSGTGSSSQTATTGYTYNQLVEDIDEGTVRTIDLQRKSDVDNYGTATVSFKDGTVAKVTIPALVSTFMDDVLHDIRLADRENNTSR